MSMWANFADIYLRGMRDRSMQSGTELHGAGNPANWLVNSKQTCLTGPLEYKYRVIFVLVLSVICVYEVQLDNKYHGLVYTTQVNSAFRARWLASSEVISQVLFTSEQPKKNKMAFVGIF